MLMATRPSPSGSDVPKRVSCVSIELGSLSRFRTCRSKPLWLPSHGLKQPSILSRVVLGPFGPLCARG